MDRQETKKENKKVTSKLQKRETKWLENYEEAKKYKKQFGNLNVPRKYVTESGLHLGEWLETQRCAKRGTGKWKITKKEISMLNKLGMNWGKQIKDKQKNTRAKNIEYMEYARRFYQENGHLDIPKNTPERQWLDTLRWAASARENKDEPPKVAKDVQGRLSKENIMELTNMGMDWNTHNYKLVERRIEDIKKYKEEFGTANIPQNYKNEDGELVGKWLARQRNKKRNTEKGILTIETINELEKLETDWNLRKSKKLSNS